jgi:hypothetical protein
MNHGIVEQHTKTVHVMIFNDIATIGQNVFGFALIAVQRTTATSSIDLVI